MKEWMIYCVRSYKHKETRYIIVRGMRDMMVQCYLKDGEYIDEVNTLDGLLDGHAIIVT